MNAAQLTTKVTLNIMLLWSVGSRLLHHVSPMETAKNNTPTRVKIIPLFSNPDPWAVYAKPRCAFSSWKPTHVKPNFNLVFCAQTLHIYLVIHGIRG